MAWELVRAQSVLTYPFLLEWNNFQKQESNSTTKHNYYAGELKSDIEVLVWREHAKALEADSYSERV